MQKFQVQILLLFFILLALPGFGQSNYQLQIRCPDREAAPFIAQTGLQTSFSSRFTCNEYVNQLQGLLQTKGYVTASLDSVRFDSLSASVVLFVGEQYKWASLDAGKVDPSLLDAVGWRAQQFREKPMNFTQLKDWQEKFLNQLENTGYPFAKIWLDSIRIDQDRVDALLKVDKGPAYLIDSIRIYGNAKISNYYLQRYLDLPNGSVYSREKLLRVNQKMRELTYIEEEKPFDLTMLATGSILNMYLKQKKSSQVNLLVGFLPNNDQLSSKKLLLTGEANILLKNALGSGETIGLNWQQIQVRSPRLNLLFNYPYLFKSPVGVDFNFDILRKDSSFVNINLQLGGSYSLSATQTGKLFVQRMQTIVNAGGINTIQVIQQRRLPDLGDVSSLNVGVEYELNKTDYRLNPRKGYELKLITAIGSKKLKKNNEVIALKDPNDPAYDFDKLYDTVKLSTYQFRARLTAAKYFPLAGGRSTIKTAFNGGMFQSGNIFRNELFQIGGYKLLRGFDEESQYLSHFALGTAEFRYLVGQNSYFYALLDGGWGRNNTPGIQLNYTFIGTGLGLALETKAGIFNLAWAVGKRNDTEFNLRQSKIHFGFVNYF
ncbi:MAG: BamA/TamA family outer membrane protein [Chitinophagaceae bacterium]|nr:BamA/TamA family outer membrane protein [Chitinophagaceae bacterium]